ncbi:MAG: hypothetical protein ABR503_00360 [Chitinophagaceae bacterium]
MERVQVLIDKLNEQKARNDSEQMLITVQLLQNELLNLNKKNVSIGTPKVSVIMPMSAINQGVNEKAETTKQPAFQKQTAEKITDTSKPEIVKSFERVELGHLENKITAPKEIITDIRKPKEEKQKIPQGHLNYLPFDAMAETPTLLQQTPPKELHEAIALKNESLNDKLKEEKRELAHKLKDAPIKDLRKGIGINDKFSFVSELFRGDEDMYERSIKTINSFHILPEAEYWMNRELKVKLGWNDNKELVQHFYQLVRRRFS